MAEREWIRLRLCGFALKVFWMGSVNTSVRGPSVSPEPCQSAGGIGAKPAPNNHALARGFGLHHFFPKTEQVENLQGRQGRCKLGRPILGRIQPLLHGKGLSRPVLLEQSSEVGFGQRELFLSNDFHTLAMLGDEGGSVRPARGNCRAQKTQGYRHAPGGGRARVGPIKRTALPASTNVAAAFFPLDNLTREDDKK